jgi:hypothetical protein
MGATRRNPKKNSETPKQTSRTKSFPKKVCLVPQMCTGAKNSYRGYPTELAPGGWKKKKLCGLQNMPDGIYRPNPKSEKNYKNIKSTNQNEFFPKKKYV